MDTSPPDENARLRALLQEQQTTIRQLAEYNRLLSQRVAAYTSEINRLKALVAKLQRMQFGKSSEKLRERKQHARCARQRSASAPCRKRWQRCWANSMTRYCHSRCASLLPVNLSPATLPRETRTLLPAETACPACGGELSALGCDVSEQLELISSAFKVIETQRPKLACCQCDHIVQSQCRQSP